MHHTAPDSSALSILRCYCARHGSSGNLLCCSPHLLPFPHKTPVGRRLPLSKHFEQPYTGGTELATSRALERSGYILRTKYVVFSTTLKALSFRTLLAPYEDLNGGIRCDVLSANDDARSLRTSHIERRLEGKKTKATARGDSARQRSRRFNRSRMSQFGLFC